MIVSFSRARIDGHGTSLFLNKIVRSCTMVQANGSDRRIDVVFFRRETRESVSAQENSDGSRRAGRELGSAKQTPSEIKIQTKNDQPWGAGGDKLLTRPRVAQKACYRKGMKVR